MRPWDWRTVGRGAPGGRGPGEGSSASASSCTAADRCAVSFAGVLGAPAVEVGDLIWWPWASTAAGCSLSVGVRRHGGCGRPVWVSSMRRHVMTMLARLDRLPLCRPHYVLLVMGGLGYTFDCMDAAIVAFLLPSVQEEWGLSSAQLGIIGSATPFGFLFGAALAGILGDRIGRREVMMYAFLLY